MADLRGIFNVGYDSVYRLSYNGQHPLFYSDSWSGSNSFTPSCSSDTYSNTFTNSYLFPDITLILQDGKLEINSCLLAAISPNLQLILQEESDLIVIPDLNYQNTYKFLSYLLDNPQNSSRSTTLDSDMKETLLLLGCNLFCSSHQFHQHLVEQQTSHQHNHQTSTEINTHQPQHSMILNNQQESQQNYILNQKENLPIKNSYQTNKEKTVQSTSHNIHPENASSISSNGHFDNTIHPHKIAKKRSKQFKDDATNQIIEVQINDQSIEQPNDFTYPHQLQNQLTCHSCSETGFTNIAAIVDHLRTVHCWNQSVEHCVYCDLPFMSNVECKNHEKSGCKNKHFMCFICGFNGDKRRENLLHHLMTVHQRGIQRKCPHCNHNFLTISTLEGRSEQWHHLEKCKLKISGQTNGRTSGKQVDNSGKNVEKKRKGLKKTCSQCGCQHTDDVWKHRRNCVALNSDIKHSCHFCNKGFRRLGSLGKHFSLFAKCKQNARNQLEYPGVIKSLDNPVKGLTTCADCGLKYSIKKGRQTHARNCSAFTKFKCFACNKGMNALDGFHIHFSKFPGCRAAKENKEIVAKLMERSAKPDFRVCHLCGAQYKTKETLDKHMLSHQEVVNYFYCQEADCGKQFLTAKSLDTHLRNHTMPMVICSICGKQVKQGSLGLHMVLHTGKKVSCPVCAKLFQHRGVLNKHFTACHTDKKRRRRKQGEGAGAMDNLLLEPIIQSLQDDLDHGGVQQSQQLSQQPQQLSQQPQQLSQQTQQLSQQHQQLSQQPQQLSQQPQQLSQQPQQQSQAAQLIVPQVPPSLYLMKTEGTEKMRSRQILVNSAGQIVLEHPNNQSNVLATHQPIARQDISINQPITSQDSLTYDSSAATSTIDLNPILQNNSDYHNFTNE